MRVSTIAVTSRPTGDAGTDDGAAQRVAKEAGAGRVRRMHRRLVTEPAQRVAKLKGVHDAAARIGRMGEDGDAQARLHAIACRGLECE